MQNQGILREVPITAASFPQAPGSHLWGIVDLSKRNSIPADESFGSSMAIGDGRFLTWRVCAFNSRQCLELVELSALHELVGGNWRILFPETLIDVKCFPLAEADMAVLIVVTVSGVRIARLQIPRNRRAALAALAVPAHEHPLAKSVYTAKEGTLITCADARVEEGDEVEIFLGTSAGTTQSIAIGEGFRVSVKTEFRQVSGGFSLFRSPAKTSGGAQRLCSVAIMSDFDILFTLSEDGKVKKWQLGNGKCIAEKVVTLEKEHRGQRHLLLAYKLVIMPVHEIIAFALKPESNDSVFSLVWCNSDKIADLRPERQEMNTSIVGEKLQQFGESGDVQTVSTFGAGVVSGEEVLLSVWQGMDISLLCVTSMEETIGRAHITSWATHVVHTQSWDIQGQLELSGLYLERYQSEQGLDSWRSKVPAAASYMEDLIFKPYCFSIPVVLSGLARLMQDYGRQPAQAWPEAGADVPIVRQYVRQTLDDLVAAETLLVWRDFLACCLQAWRQDHDLCIGIACVDFSIFDEDQGSCVLLIKSGGLSAIRVAEGTEHTFLKLLMNPVDDEDANGGDHLLMQPSTSCLWVAQQLLSWAEECDPGGNIFNQRMMKEDADDVLQDMLQAILLRAPHMHSHCDPEFILRKFPEVLNFGGDADANNSLCKSLELHLKNIEAFGESEHSLDEMPMENGEVSQWMDAAVEHACEQVVQTHYEVVRSIALFMALIDYHCRCTARNDSSHLRVILSRRIIPLLSSYHTLRWSSTRHSRATLKAHNFSQEQANPLSERTLLSLSIGSARTAALSIFNWQDVGLISYVQQPTGGCLIVRLFKELYENQHASGMGESEQEWQSLFALTGIKGSLMGAKHGAMAVLMNSDGKMNSTVVAFIKGMCHVNLQKWSEAEKCFTLVANNAYACLPQLEGLLRVVLGLRQDGRMETLQRCFQASLVGPDKIDLAMLVNEYFVLHDRQHGFFEIIHDAVGKLPPPQDHSSRLDFEQCACCAMQLGMQSLESIQSRISSLSAYDHNTIDLRVLEALSALASSSSNRLRLAQSQLYGSFCRFDEGYALIADRIRECGDLNIDKLETLDAQLHADDLHDIFTWFERSAGSGESSELEELIGRRCQQNAYRCLRMFVCAPTFRKEFTRLCSYPWVGCTNTVNTLLRQLNDVPGDQSEIDASYHARYMFNIARSDYRTAADTMLTYCYNLITRNAQDGDHVPIEVLRKQNNSCLAAINCYSLIDERFAFWAPPRIRAATYDSGKHSHGKRAMSPSGGKTEATTMGWKVTKSDGSLSAPDSLMRSTENMMPALALMDDNTDTATISHSFQAMHFSSDPAFITLPLLRRHSTLLRCRMRLAEASVLPGRPYAPQRIVSMSPDQMHAMAKHTLGELMAHGLIDDAVTLAAAFMLDCEDLVQQLTRMCLMSCSGRKTEVARFEDPWSAGADADPWEILRVYLGKLDGTRKPLETSSHTMPPIPSTVGSYAFGRLHRIAGETILSWPDAHVPLPPWLKRAMHSGVRSSDRLHVPRFDTPRADTTGLLRLYLRYGRLQDASQLVAECLEVEVSGNNPAEEYALMDLSTMRYVPYNLIDQLLFQLKSKASQMASANPPDEQMGEMLACQQAVENALKRWLSFTAKEANTIREWCSSQDVGDAVAGMLRQHSELRELNAQTVKLLVNQVTNKVKQTPFGTRFIRTLSSGQVNRVDADSVFELMCLQMLQRSCGRDAILPNGRTWTDFYREV